MSTAILEYADPAKIEAWGDEPELQRKTENRTLAPEDAPQELAVEREYEFTIDYSVTSFPVEGDISIKVADPTNKPIRLGYADKKEVLDVIGWGLTVPLENAGDLSRIIGRRFLDLYSKAVRGSLPKSEEDCLRTVSEQMDYHSFAASRKMPRYREATLVRKVPVVLLQFIGEQNAKVDKALLPKLIAIDAGERFSAWFKTGPDGQVLDFEHVLRLPSLDEDLADMPLAADPVQLPKSLKDMLPKLDPGEQS